MFDFANIAGGALVGALLACVLMLWVKVFVKEVYAKAPENYAKISFDRNSKNIPDWVIIAVMTITAGVFAWWRQWNPEFFSDIILVTALAGVALIDRKTMLIEGRLIALALSLIHI